MEKRKMRNLLLVGMIALGTVGASSVFAGDKESPSIEGNRLANRKEYKDIKNTLSRIEDDQARIAYHKEQLKINKENDQAIQAHMSKKEIRKAKADLRRDKKYLRIDKHDLKSDQALAIDDQKKEERELKKDLRHAKRELRKDTRQENVADLEADIENVALIIWKLEQEDKETAALEEDVDEFFAYLETEIEDVV